eukprot:49273-Prymnesium_polylepis.1
MEHVEEVVVLHLELGLPLGHLRSDRRHARARLPRLIDEPLRREGRLLLGSHPRRQGLVVSDPAVL